MARRSLQASEEGINKARKAYNNQGWTQEGLAEAAGLKTRSAIGNFFARKPINRNNFIEICTALDLNWEEIVQQEAEDSIAETAASSAIADTVQAIREQIKPLVKERCGTMRVLDMTQPIKLTGEQGIYTNVNILEKITARDRREIAHLLQNASLEEFDRFGLSRVTEERISGIEAVRRHKKLMVLGKPGAGKTTFLKYLAMQCIEGHFLSDRVPLFITLKDFAETRNQPDFLHYIQESLTNNAIQSQIQDVIQQGRAFVLLDGLDEVREEDTGRVLRQIRDFSDQFANNHFVITCRIAAKEYVFERFTEVEVADFNNEQISTFIRNWFRCKDPAKGEEFAKQIIKKLDENKPIKELASNPLLLTLLCLECEESLEFPKNRAELYERGLRVLLSKWDASRKIQRDQFYEKLSVNRKEDLLSQLALKTFEQKDYFFKQRTVEQHITDYIINLPDAKTDPQALQLDSEAALKSIEAQHGLLVERARGIYSFSHLTFQEYFTAKQIVNEADYARLVERLTEKRWREVFLLTANIMPKADRLLLLAKHEINTFSKKHRKLELFLRWLEESAQRNREKFYLKEFSLSVIRAFLLDITLDNTLLGDSHFANDVYHVTQYIPDRLEIASSKDNVINLRIANIHHFSWYADLAYKLNYNFSYASLFKSKAQLIDYKALPQSRRWWAGFESHAITVYDLINKYAEIHQEWQFDKEQYQLLRQYYDANKLLVDCLNSDCYVSRDVRQEIEETVLLPMSEIEKRKNT